MIMKIFLNEILLPSWSSLLMDIWVVSSSRKQIGGNLPILPPYDPTKTFIPCSRDCFQQLRYVRLIFFCWVPPTFTDISALISRKRSENFIKFGFSFFANKFEIVVWQTTCVDCMPILIWTIRQDHAISNLICADSYRSML